MPKFKRVDSDYAVTKVGKRHFYARFHWDGMWLFFESVPDGDPEPTGVYDEPDAHYIGYAYSLDGGDLILESWLNGRTRKSDLWRP